MSNSVISFLKSYGKSREFKEILVAHSIIVVICAIIYVLAEPVYSAVAFGTLIFLELICFHTLWYYRDHKEENTDNPLQRAILDEIITLGLGIVGLIVSLFIVIVLYTTIGLNPFLGLVSILILTMVYMVLKVIHVVYKAD